MLVTTVVLVAGSAGVAAAATVPAPAHTWGVNGQVLTILPVGDRIYVGGTFSAAVDTSGISYPVSNLAVFSRSTGEADLAFDADPSGTVTSLATDGTNLFVGGAFNKVSSGGIGYARSDVASVNLSTGSVNAWRPMVSGGQVDTVAYSTATNSLYLGGNFTSVKDAASTVAPGPYLASVSASTGLVNSGFAPTPNGRVRSVNVAANGSGLYIGGDFTSVAGQGNTKSLTRVNALTGAVDSSFRPAPTNQGNYAPVFDVTSDGSRVYVAVGGAGGACTALTAATGAAVWTHHTNGNGQSVRVLGSTVYCAGHFSGTASFDGYTRYKLAAVDAATGAVLSFAPNVNTALGVWSLGTQPGDPTLYIGGDFTKVAGVYQPHFAMFPDQADLAVPQPPRSLVAQPANGCVWLSWLNPSSDKGAKITKFRVYRSTTPGGLNLSRQPMATVKWAAGSSIFSYQDTTVVNGTKYYYQVTATNAVGAGPGSNQDAATPSSSIAVQAPSAPVSFLVTNPPGSLQLTWNPPLDNGGSPIRSYNVYRGTAPGDEGSVPYATGVKATSFSDVNNLVAGTTYYYRIAAVNAAGEGQLSYETSAVQQPSRPGAPVLAVVVTGGTARLSWGAPPDGGSPITKYVVTRDAVRLQNLSGTTRTTVDATAKSGVQYTYQVRAVNAYGNGKMSNKVTVTIP